MTSVVCLGGFFCFVLFSFSFLLFSDGSMVSKENRPKKKKNLLTSCQAIACCDNVFEPDAGTTKEIQAETFTEKV
jgi:hypothetical protein